MVEYECGSVEEAIEETLEQLQAEREGGVPAAIDPQRLRTGARQGRGHRTGDARRRRSTGM